LVEYNTLIKESENNFRIYSACKFCKIENQGGTLGTPGTLETLKITEEINNETVLNDWFELNKDELKRGLI
jgi:hypothetical protein